MRYREVCRFESDRGHQPSRLRRFGSASHLTRRLSRRSPKDEGGPWPGAQVQYVYILESLTEADRFYVGVTAELKARLKTHDDLKVSHTSKFAPWRIKTYVAPRRAAINGQSNGQYVLAAITTGLIALIILANGH